MVARCCWVRVASGARCDADILGDPHTELRHPPAIDEDPAALDELVGLAPRADPALGHQLGEPHAFDGGTRLCRLGNGGSGGGGASNEPRGGIGEVALLATGARGGVVAARRRAHRPRAWSSTGGARSVRRPARFEAGSRRGRALVSPRRAPLGAGRAADSPRGARSLSRGEAPGVRAARSPRAGFAVSSRRAGSAPSSRRGARSLRAGFAARSGRREGRSPAAGRAGASSRGVRAPGSRLAPGGRLLGGRFVVRGLAHAERALDARGLRGGRLSADGVQRDSPGVRGRIIADRQASVVRAAARVFAVGLAGRRARHRRCSSHTGRPVGGRPSRSSVCSCRWALAMKWALIGAVMNRKAVISTSWIDSVPSSPAKKTIEADQCTTHAERGRLGGCMQAGEQVGQLDHADRADQQEGAAGDDQQRDEEFEHEGHGRPPLTR